MKILLRARPHQPTQCMPNAAQLTDKIYNRLSWKRFIYCIAREAANFYYSRLKVSENQVFAKSQMVYLIRDARHVGLALGLDSVRFYAIDIDIRSLSDFLVLKSQGLYGLTKDLHFLYSIFEPHIVRNMPPQFFFIIGRRGCVGVGGFKEIPWHKKERENILKACGVKVEYGEPIEVGQYRGTFKTVGDEEHAEIIRLYVDEALSLDRIAEKLGRSSRTPHEHIKRHNRAVERSSFCPACMHEQVYLLATTLAIVLGAIGGIPQILRWFKPQPSLKIIELEVQTTEKKSSYNLHLKVLNEVKWWRRKSDATYVKSEIFIMDKNYEQWTGIHGTMLTPFLLTGAKVSKEIPFVQNFISNEPYTFIVVVHCVQGVWTKETITYTM